MTDAARPESSGVEATDAARARHPLDHPVRRFIDANRAPLGTFAVLVVMMAIFIAANPHVFLEWNIYRSVLTTLPVALFLVVPLVFVVTAGEIDLSFPSTMGFSAWMFALVVQAGFSPYLGLAAAMADRRVARLFRRRACRLFPAVVADRDAGHELHAARRDPDRHRGQVDRAGFARRKARPSRFSRASCSAFRRRCSGRSPLSCSRRCSSIATSSARM